MKTQIQKHKKPNKFQNTKHTQVTKIKELRKIFLEKGEIIGNLEETSGNYNNKGDLIERSIPTFTTEFCEIGIYDEIVYFTFVIYSDSYNKQLIENLKDFSNFQIYGFKNFKKDLSINSDNFEKEIKKEKYFQINFDYSVDDDNQYLYEQYIIIKKLIFESGVKVVNQLDVDLTKD